MIKDKICLPVKSIHFEPSTDEMQQCLDLKMIPFELERIKKIFSPTVSLKSLIPSLKMQTTF